METIVNKIAQSGIITLDLEYLLSQNENIVAFDLKPFLFKEMILKEKDFRTAISELTISDFKDKTIAVFCSVDAIIPKWAYMLIGSMLQPVSSAVYFGSKIQVEEQLLLNAIRAINAQQYSGKRVIIKGCGDRLLPDSAYLAISLKLRPVVKSLMYGEACSTVPVFKEKKISTF